jgi:hypothetical protein
MSVLTLASRSGRSHPASARQLLSFGAVVFGGMVNAVWIGVLLWLVYDAVYGVVIGII